MMSFDTVLDSESIWFAGIQIKVGRLKVLYFQYHIFPIHFEIWSDAFVIGKLSV